MQPGGHVRLDPAHALLQLAADPTGKHSAAHTQPLPALSHAAGSEYSAMQPHDSSCPALPKLTHGEQVSLPLLPLPLPLPLSNFAASWAAASCVAWLEWQLGTSTTTASTDGNRIAGIILGRPVYAQREQSFAVDRSAQRVPRRCAPRQSRGLQWP
jgi:hypothetical protein